jgi:hypothetical protein
LVHALAVRQEASQDLELRLPKPEQLDDISPLPLSVPVLLTSGILTVPPGSNVLQAAIDKLKASTEPQNEHVEVDVSMYEALLARSVEVCGLLREAGGKEGLSYLDIHLAIQSLEEAQAKSQGSLLLIPADA